MVEQRDYVRYALWFPVTVELGDLKIGTICRDASTGGVLLSSPVMVENGKGVNCRFRVSPADADELCLPGKIVRGERNADDLELVFPFRLAVGFEPPRLDIEELLKNAQARGPQSR
jgi:hypothetical protein